MNKLNFNLHEWEKEKLDELVESESRRVDLEESYNRGAQEMIRSMFKNGVTLEFISVVLGKSIEEIKDIIS